MFSWGSGRVGGKDPPFLGTERSKGRGQRESREPNTSLQHDHLQTLTWFEPQEICLSDWTPGLHLDLWGGLEDRLQPSLLCCLLSGFVIRTPQS